MATRMVTDAEFLAFIRGLVAEGLAELEGDDRAWAARRVVEPRTIEVTFPDPANSVETMWLVTECAPGDPAEHRIVYDPARVTFGIIEAGPPKSQRPVLVGLYGDFAETVQGR